MVLTMMMKLLSLLLLLARPVLRRVSDDDAPPHAQVRECAPRHTGVRLQGTAVQGLTRPVGDLLVHAILDAQHARDATRSTSLTTTSISSSPYSARTRSNMVQPRPRCTSARGL